MIGTVTIDAPAAPPPPPAATEQLVPKPYPGLRPFKETEWSIFRGREIIVHDLIDLLADRNLVLVHGGSGSGKSSLVKAGVIPALEQVFAGDGKPTCAHATIRPSQGPFRALAAALAKHLGAPEDTGDPVDWWATQLMFAPRTGDEQDASPSHSSATTAQETAAEPPDGETVPDPQRKVAPNRTIVGIIEDRIKARGLQGFCLVVDQFEEIFPWARDRRRSDVQLLADFLGQVLATRESDLFFVILTMRSDYLGECAQFPALTRIISDCQFYLANLDARGIERAIVEPAAMYGGTIDQALLARLMLMPVSVADPLPILQHGLMRMAEPHLEARRKTQEADPTARPTWTLTLDDFRRINSEADGKDSNALSVHANAVLAGLKGLSASAWLEAAEWIFRSLLEVDVGGKAIRRPQDFQTLASVSGLTEAQTKTFVDAFAAEGVTLLGVSDTGEGLGRRRVDISHEALLRNWDRMIGQPPPGEAGWIQKEFEDGLNWRMLARVASTPHASVDSITTHQVKPFMDSMAAAPERARRYLLPPPKRDAVIKDQDEWRRVTAMVSWSRTKALLKVIVAALVGLAVIAAGVFGLWSRQAAQLAKQEADYSDRLRREAEASRDLQQSSTSAVARLEGEVKSLTEQTDKSPETQVTTGFSAAGAIGFIWTGLRATPTLKTLLGNKVAVDKVVKGQPYALIAPLKLRSAPNVGRVGALSRGSAVLALSDAQKGPNSQYWVQVRSIPLKTVFLQYATGSTSAAASLRATLAEESYYVPGAQQLPQAQGLREVRYCRQDDAGSADVVAKVVAAKAGGAPLSVKWIGQNGSCQAISKPGTIELWLGTLPADRPATG